jgi:hypothetical protein
MDLPLESACFPMPRRISGQRRDLTLFFHLPILAQHLRFPRSLPAPLPMKSEHRHELKTNELERLATEWRDAAEHFVQEHPGWLGVGAVVVVVAIVGVLYWTSSSGRGDERGWQAMSKASSAADFANIADKYPNQKLAAWARLQEAESELFSGTRLEFTDRNSGVSDLKKAKENFEKLIKDKKTPDEALERAMFGLAQCTEALPADPNTPPSKINDAAIAAYENLLNRFRDSVFLPIAKARIDSLKTGRTQDFYAWFDKQNPKPADREIPKDLIPPAPEPFSSSALPGSTESAGTTEKGSKSEAAPSGKTGSAPGGSQKATEKKPASSSPKTPGAGPTIPGQ